MVVKGLSIVASLGPAYYRGVNRFQGHIMGAAFSTGHRIVVGRWGESPLGGFCDIMWRQPDGTRVLLAPTEAVRDFVGRHYRFEDSHVVPVSVKRSADLIQVRAGELALDLRLMPPGIASLMLALQPQRLALDTRWISFVDATMRPLLAPLLVRDSDTRLHGMTRDGAREWYAIQGLRKADAYAQASGLDLGPLGSCPPARFGFSEFPGGAAVVKVTALFDRLA